MISIVGLHDYDRCCVRNRNFVICKYDERLLLLFDSVSIVQRIMTSRGYWLFNLSLFWSCCYILKSLSCLYFTTKPFKSLFEHNTFFWKFHINLSFFPFFLFFHYIVKRKDKYSRFEIVWNCTLRNFLKNFEQKITFLLTSNLDCYDIRFL